MTLIISSCASHKRPKTIPREAQVKYPPVQQGAKTKYEMTPQRNASASLVSKGVKDMEREDYERAGYSFQEAVHVDPSNADAYYYLALIKYVEGEYDKSLSFLERSESLAGDNKDLLKKIADLRNSISSVKN